MIKQTIKQSLFLLLPLLAFSACKQEVKKENTETQTETQTENILLQEWCSCF
jgi:hypothetical protein